MFPEYREHDLSVLTFNLTWYCPVKCPYCYITMKVSRDDRTVLPESILARECEVGAEYGIGEYRFSGGEPTVLGDKLFEYADLVFDKTGMKPSLLTSGIGITEKWLKKARNKFHIIAVSVENPLEPQTSVDNRRMLDRIREHACDEGLPFRYGVTLITASHFKNVERVFDLLHENVDGQFMPQLDYPCLKDYVNPSASQLHDIFVSTRSLFRQHGVIPYYFVYLVPSLLWLEKNALRIVLNLYPDGKYEIYESLPDRWQVEYKWRYYALEQQKASMTCRQCEWSDSCTHHPEGRLRYDWCDLRRAVFQGIYAGLDVESESPPRRAV